MLGLGKSAFTVLMHKRGWKAERTSGASTRYLRADIEAELEARDARPPITGARTPEPKSTQDEGRERNCLRCRSTFWSAHKGRRLCERCNLVARSLRSALL